MADIAKRTVPLRPSSSQTNSLHALVNNRPSELGSLLASIAGEASGLTDAEAEAFDQLRDKTPAEPMRFE